MKRKKESEYFRYEDCKLAEMSAAGDNEAFSELILRHQKALKRYVSFYCSNTADAEDICQESFHKAFRSIASYNPEYPFKTWLLYIARHSAIDHLRRRNPYSVINLNESEEMAAAVTKNVPSPEEEMIGTQIYGSFVKIVENLPPKYREAAKLRFISEYCYEDIAKELDLPLNTVRTRIRRARLMISEILKSNI